MKVVYVKGVNYLRQINLVEMKCYAGINSGKKHILTVVDALKNMHGQYLCKPNH